MALRGKIANTKVVANLGVRAVLASGTGKGIIKNMIFRFQTHYLAVGTLRIMIDGVTTLEVEYSGTNRAKPFAEFLIGYIQTATTETSGTSKIADVTSYLGTSTGDSRISGSITLNLPYQQSFEISVIQDKLDAGGQEKQMSVFYAEEV